MLDFSVYDTPMCIVLFASVSTPVDSPSERAAFLWIFLSTSHLLDCSVRSQFLGENVFLLTPAGLALLLAPAGFVSVLDCSVYDTSW